MIVEPKVREFICTTAHPTGCYENVKRQIAYVKDKGTIEGPKRVLVIGASTGYGLEAVLQLHLHVRLPQLESCLKSHQMENARQLRDGIIRLHLKKKPKKMGFMQNQ